MKYKKYLMGFLDIIRHINKFMNIVMVLVYFMIRIFIVSTIILVMQMNKMELHSSINTIMQIYVLYPVYHYMFEKIYWSIRKVIKK